MGDLCDNVGLVLACLMSGNTASPMCHDLTSRDPYLVSCTF